MPRATEQPHLKFACGQTATADRGLPIGTTAAFTQRGIEQAMNQTHTELCNELAHRGFCVEEESMKTQHCPRACDAPGVAGVRRSPSPASMASVASAP